MGLKNFAVQNDIAVFAVNTNDIALLEMHTAHIALP
jgi:hypothetical protein